jgi:hypothetical protein
MKKIRNEYITNLRYFFFIFIFTFGLIAFVGCGGGGDDAVAPVPSSGVIDNSSFYGDYTLSMTFDSCKMDFQTITIGGDSTRKDEDDYIYVPKNQSSITYTKGDRTESIDISGLTVYYTEVGQDFSLDLTLTFSSDYNSFTIDGDSVENDPSDCDGTVTGNGIRVGTEGVTIGFNYLQYRTPANRYLGYLDIYKDGIPSEASDVTKIELKDSNGDTVNTTMGGLGINTYYIGEWNSQTSSVDFSGLTFWAGYSITFPDGFELPADDYTWEVTTSDNKLISKQITFPGQKVLPFVDSATMQSVWQPDGSLQLSWTNPVNTADYEELSVVLNTVGASMLWIYLPVDKNEVTIPSDWVEILEKFYDPTTVSWQILTRSYTVEDMNYARGISNSAPITWNVP